MPSDFNIFKNNLNMLQNILRTIEFEFINDPRWLEPSNSAYLNDSDREDPDIMSNVEAIEATNLLISWLGRDYEGYIGLWQGPSNQPLLESPIVRLDTEGQYEIVATTIADYLLISAAEDDFSSIQKTLFSVGFSPSASVEIIWESIEGMRESVNKYRHEIYNQQRLKRGLKAI
jgi:hypothetical protein